MALELGEKMTDDELKEMIYEANQCDRDGSVGLEDFMTILGTKDFDQLNLNRIKTIIFNKNVGKTQARRPYKASLLTAV